LRINLDTLRTEIQEYLESRSLVLFHSFPRSGQLVPAVYWDTEMHPDYREFISAAEAAGAKLITFFVREFSPDLLDEAWDHLEQARLDRDERRALEQRLGEAASYTGFTCQIELSFDSGPRVYVFDLRTDWFEDMSDLLDRIEDAQQDARDDPGPTGPYFSKN
jgi:hypothetical protein